MKLNNYLLSVLAFAGVSAFSSCTANKPVEEAPVLKSVFPDYTMGVALNVAQSNGLDQVSDSIVIRHFNSIVPENCMKHEEIHPEKDVYNFEDADRFVQFGVDHDMQIIGHCLVWHSQQAPWLFVGDDGKQVSAEELKARMKEHITTVVTRYKGKITGWDVVNEAVVEDGSYRNSLWYQILGEDFIPLAFQYAHEADPDLELYYNDYGMAVPGRREGVVRLIRHLKEHGCRIDAVGLQSHMGMDHPDWDEFEASIQAYIAEGVDVQFTEVDMSALPSVNFGANVSDTEEYQESLNPYPTALPDSVSAEWNARMTKFFEIVDKYKDHVKRVTAWGVTDEDSWKNDWPIEGRTDYCLWFDRQNQLKPFLQQKLDAAK